MYSGPGVFKQPPEYQSPIPPPLSPAQIPSEYQRQAEGLGRTGKDIVPVGLSELLPEGAQRKLPRWAQTGLGMMLDTLRRMAAPPPISGPGFAISNLAQALAGGLEAPYQRSVEMAKASEELAKQTAERQLAQQTLATNALYPLYGMGLQRAALFRPVIDQGPWGVWAATPEGAQSLNSSVYQSLQTTFGAAQDSLNQLVNDKSLPEEFRIALKGAMDMFAAGVQSGAPPAQLWQILERLSSYMERAPYLGLVLDRLNLEKLRATIYHARTLLSVPTIRQGQTSMLASHEVAALVNSAITLLNNPNMYNQLNQIAKSPQAQAIIKQVGEEVAREMQRPGQFREYLDRLWQRLTMGANTGVLKGIFTSPEMANYYTTLSQIAAWMAYLHTQGKGSVEMALGYSDLLKMFLGPESARGMLASLARYSVQLHERWADLTKSSIAAISEANPKLGAGFSQMLDPVMSPPRVDPQLGLMVETERQAQRPGVTLGPHAVPPPTPAEATPQTKQRGRGFVRK
jgi:hypothetical protein